MNLFLVVKPSSEEKNYLGVLVLLLARMGFEKKFGFSNFSSMQNRGHGFFIGLYKHYIKEKNKGYNISTIKIFFLD